MGIRVTPGPGTGAVVTLHGELDLDAAADVDHAVEQCLNAGRRVLLLDLADVAFCDSSGVNALIRAHQRATGAGGAVHLVAPQPPVARVLALIGVDQVLTVHQDLPSALTATA